MEATVAFEPIWVGKLELSAAPRLDAAREERRDHAYRRARVLITLHGQPLGFLKVRVPDGGLDVASLAQAAASTLEQAVTQHLQADGATAASGTSSEEFRSAGGCQGRPHDGRPISVVLSTRDRPRQLGQSLEQLRRLRYAGFEVVVVDNAPSGPETAESFERTVGDDPRFRYVSEPLPGLSRARNRGLREASFDYVAFTDDDALVDPMWLDGIASGFARDPRVGCVTGLVPSAELESVSQRYFDQRVWWSSKVEPHVYDLRLASQESLLFPYDAGRIGTGANFAVDRALMVGLGGFDERLGAGSPTLGGEDLDAFLRILRSGRSIAYVPAAIVWHIHRGSLEDLQPHLYGYGAGLGAYLAKYLVDPETRGELVRRLIHAVPHLVALWSRAGSAQGRRHALIGSEIRGMAAGPFRLRRAGREGWSRPTEASRGGLARGG